jgi:PAS domain S-box-containing protein
MKTLPLAPYLVDQVHGFIDTEAILAITDRRGCIVHANERFCRISGYSEAELLGRSHRILKSGVHSDALYRGLWAGILRGETWRGELCNRRKDGTLYWVDTFISPLRTDGEITHFLSVRIDITDRKRAEEQLAEKIRQEEANRRTLAVGRMAQAMLHDLNNVLTGVMGLASETLGGHGTSLLNDAIRRMAQMTHTLKVFATGQIEAPSVCELNPLIRCACSMVSFREATRHSVIVVPDLAASSGVRICCDEAHFFQALLNLCVNAAEAAARVPRGEVRVRTAVEDDVVSIEVADNGPGVPPEVLPNLFEEYVSSKGPGRGIGLSVARRIMDSHGGSLRLASPGGGTEGGAVFRITLPVRDRSAAEDVAPAEFQAPSAGVGGYVVVHEDNPDAQRLIRRAATTVGLHPVVVGNSSLLVEMAEKSRGVLALAVLDSCSLATPENDVARLRQVVPDLPILLVSADETDAGAADTPWGRVEKLPKPFTLQAVSEAMRRAAAPRSAVERPLAVPELGLAPRT